MSFSEPLRDKRMKLGKCACLVILFKYMFGLYCLSFKIWLGCYTHCAVLIGDHIHLAVRLCVCVRACVLVLWCYVLLVSVLYTALTGDHIRPY